MPRSLLGLGVKYFGPGDKKGPTLVNHGRRRYVVKVGGFERILKAHVVPVRKPLLRSLRLVGYWPRRALHSGRQLGRAPQDRRGDQLHPARWEVRDRCGGAAPEPVGKRVGASFAVSPIEGAGVPPREGAQDALPEGEQLRQHQAAAGGGGVVPLLAPGMPTAAERARHEVDHCPYQTWCRSLRSRQRKGPMHTFVASRRRNVSHMLPPTTRSWEKRLRMTE